MTEVIDINVVGNSVRNTTKINLDDKPLGMTYPMTSPSERQFAYNKYYRWFWNSVDLNTDKVMEPLHQIVAKALVERQIVIGSEFHNQKSHVDVILEYLSNEFRRRGFEVNTHRALVQG